jgi:transketolase
MCPLRSMAWRAAIITGRGLSNESRLGPYEVIAPLDASGMESASSACSPQTAKASLLETRRAGRRTSSPRTWRGCSAGLSLSKLRPFGSGFLIFSDYGRAAIRLSALMEIPVIHIFTHDSIGVGEDGPTHQPVEHLACLRAIPGLITLRPADANEAVAAWRVIARLRHKPVALILTRQAVPTLDRTRYAAADGVQRGAYVVADADDGTADVLLLAPGSEVSLCIEAHERLANEGIKARVVSMPSWEIFKRYCRDHPEYREQVLPQSVAARVSVEKTSTLGWGTICGRRRPQHRHGDVRRVGAAGGIAEGFTPEHIVEAAMQ